MRMTKRLILVAAIAAGCGGGEGGGPHRVVDCGPEAAPHELCEQACAHQDSLAGLPQCGIETSDGSIAFCGTAFTDPASGLTGCCFNFPNDGDAVFAFHECVEGP